MDNMEMTNTMDTMAMDTTQDVVTPEVVPETTSGFGDVLKGAAPGLIGFIIGAAAAYGYHKYQQYKMEKEAEETK